MMRIRDFVCADLDRISIDSRATEIRTCKARTLARRLDQAFDIDPTHRMIDPDLRAKFFDPIDLEAIVKHRIDRQRLQLDRFFDPRFQNRKRKRQKQTVFSAGNSEHNSIAFIKHLELNRRAENFAEQQLRQAHFDHLPKSLDCKV